MFAQKPLVSPSSVTGWRSPVVMLMLMAAAMHISFAVWGALLNNFTIERGEFTGAEIGMLQSIREIPGFLSFAVVFLLLLMREQLLALVSLLLLGLGTAATGYFPSTYGLYITTFIMSVGFHYYETVNQSLSLQWLSKSEAPRQMGKIIAVGSFSTIAAYGLIYLTWNLMGLGYVHVYAIGGLVSVAIVVFLRFAYPRFSEEVPQRKHLFLRKRYWLYYALTFMSGARRQIFIVFAGFMMVEKFGYSVTQLTTLFLANAVFNMIFAPMIGSMIGKWGERRALTFEYVGLVLIFVTYAFVTNPWIAAGLYLVDHAFFALAIAIKTYFQKIADPADIAPTAGVAFSINHIAAVGIPVSFGLIWLGNPAAVFLMGAGMAFVSLILARLIPTTPEPGQEFIWSRRPYPVPSPASD